MSYVLSGAFCARPTHSRQCWRLQTQFGSSSRAFAAARSSAVTQHRTATMGPVVSLFGGSKSDSKTNYICVDCGYIYDGRDFSKEPSSYKCPYCTSTKRRFKKYKGTVRGRVGNSSSARSQRFKAREW